MAKTFLVSTVSAGTITLRDLGNITFTHTVTDRDLALEFDFERLRDSIDLPAALEAGTLTATFDGVAITSQALFDEYIVDFDHVLAADNETRITNLEGDSHLQNSDTKLAEGTGDEVSANEIRTFIDSKGDANGLASLDAGGKVPAAQLPSYVDDVLEYANLAAFPVTGETGKIYVALDTNKTYRWSGSVYIEISSQISKGAQTMLFSENGSINNSRDLKYGNTVSTVTQATCNYTGVIRGININSDDLISATYQITVSINGIVQVTKTVTAATGLNDFALNQAITAGDRVKVRFVKTAGNINDLNVCLNIIEL